VRWGTLTPLIFSLSISLFPCHSALAADHPRIAIIIDDLGDNLVNGLRAVRLSGDVTCSFLPFAPYTKDLARQAHFQDKEVMLHLPMDSLDDRHLGPGGLKVGMLRDRFVKVLREDLRAVPYATGVNNHMGSLLTQLPENMEWLMTELQRYPFYFVDSRTTRSTVARNYAMSWGIPSQKRDVFLDNRQTRPAIIRQFRRLLAIAKARGQAVAIGHPYDVTLDVLEEWLPRLARDEGVELVHVSRLLDGTGRRPLPELDMALAKTEINAGPVAESISQ